MPHTYTQLTYHIVYGTKDRLPLITNAMRPRLWEYLGGAIRSEGGIALLVNGVADHVHILARLRPDKAISDILRDIKANSSAWVHDNFPNCPFNWQAGYGAFTVSRSQEPRVLRVHRDAGRTSPQDHVRRRIRSAPQGPRHRVR